VLGGHLEYRLGAFQGLRAQEVGTDVASNNFFRIDGRIQVNLLDAEPGFFYAGTYLGAKKILSLGGAFDFQSSYKYFAGDALVAAKGDIFAGLWYPVVVAAITFVVGAIFIRETRDHRIDTLWLHFPRPMSIVLSSGRVRAPEPSLLTYRAPEPGRGNCCRRH
jgi:hypothetical protein